jgi:PAS domain S-box-containing protein
MSQRKVSRGRRAGPTKLSGSDRIRAESGKASPLRGKRHGASKGAEESRVGKRAAPGALKKKRPAPRKAAAGTKAESSSRNEGGRGGRQLVAAEPERTSEHHRALNELAAGPILVLSAGFEILEANTEAERVFGHSRNELVGQVYFSICNGTGLTRAKLRRALAGQPAHAIEDRVRRADGTERVLLWNMMRVADAGAGSPGVFAVAQDITERDAAERALREREARLSSVISTAPDAIITIDERGRIQSFSYAAEQLFLYSAGEVIGQNVKMLMPSPHQELHDGYLARYLRTGEKRIIGIGRTVEAQRKDGSVFPMELAVGEVNLGGTRIFTGFIRDISARSRMEAELRQAQKMEAIGQLTGGLAHDFNNILTVITGNLEILERRLSSEDDLDLLNEANEAAGLGTRLASRLLAFGRRQPLNPRPLNLSDLAGGMTDLLRRTLGEVVQLETRLKPDLRMTMADPGQVENALLNLAINARDAMPQGGRLIVATDEVELDSDYAAAGSAIEAGQYVMLSVTDTGTGMAPDVAQRAFEPFFTTKPVGSGSGLGLSMIYGFVKQSGGHVKLYSEQGIGTTVSIYLPGTGTEAALPAAPKAKPTATAHGETILLVEDDPRVRRVSARRLRELGYSVIEVDGPVPALEAIDRGDAVDLLFTDVVMPGGMSGVDLAHEARSRRPELRILLTSGFADPDMIGRGLRTLNAGWLSKPHSIADLARKLRELLSR